jgi:iron complex transport system substrate-binding protein
VKVVRLVVGILVAAVVAVALVLTFTGWIPSYGVVSTVYVTSVVERPTTVVLRETVTETAMVTVTEVVERARVVDAVGRVVELGVEPRRVVSLAPSITEIVCALGCCDRLVGVDRYSNYPPEVVRAVEEGRIAVVGGYWNPDPEKIAGLDPDVVLASSSVPAHRALEKVLDVPIVYLRSGASASFDDVYADIALVDEVLGCPGEAKQLVDAIRSRIELVARVLEEANATKVSVLVLLGLPEWGVWAAGAGTFIDSVITAAGGSNVASRLHGWVMLGQEDLATMKPRIVLVALMAADVEDARKALRAWKEALRDLRYERICVLWGPANDVLVRPGPRLGIAVELVASLLHPDLVETPPELANYVVCG